MTLFQTLQRVENLYHFSLPPLSFLKPPPPPPPPQESHCAKIIDSLFRLNMKKKWAIKIDSFSIHWIPYNGDLFSDNHLCIRLIFDTIIIDYN